MRIINQIIITSILFYATLGLSEPINASQPRTNNTWDLVRQEMTNKNAESAKPAESVGSPEQIKSDTTGGAERTLHFPKEHSLGRLSIGNENSYSAKIFFGGYPFEEIRWESFGQAIDDVKIPKGKIVQLILNSWTWQNPQALSALKQLKPDDIHSLTLSPEWSSGGRSPDDKCMSYVTYLTGLKVLNIDGANITAKGLESLTALKSLERLKAPANFNDSGMLVVGKLKTLVALCIDEKNTVTNNGLKQIAGLKALRILQIISVSIKDEGLKVLSGLPSLNYLVLGGKFTNDAALYLKDVPSLRVLKIDPGQFDDSGMKNISGLTQLENIDAHWMEGITDEGIAYLKNMPNLKKLDIYHSKLTDKGLSYLQACTKIEYLNLPGGIGNTGLTHIGRFSNLKHLEVYSDSYTDNGIAELTKCKLLEELSMGGSGITNESLRYISELKNLENLNIGGSGLTDEGLFHLAKLNKLESLYWRSRVTGKSLDKLEGLQSLVTLRLSGLSISELKSLNRFKNLTRLNLEDLHQDNSSAMDITGLTKLEDCTIILHRDFIKENNKFVYESSRDQDWACLAKLINLKNLQISGVGITDNGIKYLSDLNNLDFLNIICPGESKITDEGLKYLSDKPKLYRLIINSGHFTDKALNYLSGMPALNTLELTSDVAFSRKAAANFQTKNPNVERLQLKP
jgi:internalin A